MTGNDATAAAHSQLRGHVERRHGEPPMHVDIDGACLCGYIRYEARIDRSKIRLCHCTQCQEQSATAFGVAVLVERENFRLLGGEPKTYVKKAQSGNPRALTFCPECGASLYGCNPADPQVYSLRLGTARQRADLVPVLQMWMQSAMPWLFALADIPAFPKGASPADVASMPAKTPVENLQIHPEGK